MVPNHQSFQSLRDVVELQEPAGAPLSCWGGENKNIRPTPVFVEPWRSSEIQVSLRTPLFPGNPPFKRRGVWVHKRTNPKAKEWFQESTRQEKSSGVSLGAPYEENKMQRDVIFTFRSGSFIKQITTHIYRKVPQSVSNSWYTLQNQIVQR